MLTLWKYRLPMVFMIVGLQLEVPQASGEDPVTEVEIPKIDLGLQSSPLMRKILSLDDHEKSLEEEAAILEASLFPGTGSDEYPSYEDWPEPAVETEIEETESPGETKLISLARKIASSVVSIRVWDHYGAELRSGAGFFVSSNGLVLTDAGLIHPRFSKLIAYATIKTGDGRRYATEGVVFSDLKSGIALLQIDSKDETPPLRFSPTADLSKPLAVAVVGLHETKGLSLSDASMKPDETVAGAGWLTIEGNDSPAAVGSPVLDLSGQVLALSSLQVPLDDWKNFAVPIRSAVTLLEGKSASVIPFDQLAEIETQDVSENKRFMDAALELYNGNASRASTLLRPLIKQFPRSAEPWALLGLAQAKLGNIKEAIACGYRAAAINPEIKDYWRQLAASISSMNQSTAEDVFSARKQFAETNPSDPKAQFGYALELLKRSDWESAEEVLMKLRNHRKAPARTGYYLALSLAKNGSHPESKEVLRSYLDENADDSNAWFLAGLLYDVEDQHEYAIRAYEISVKHDPDFKDAWANLRHAYLASGNKIRAREAHRQWLKLGT